VIPLFPVYLFDVDGTLLDSAGDIVGAIQEVLAAHGRRMRPISSSLKNYIGHHLAAPFGDIFPDYNSAQIDELIRQYRVNYLAREPPADARIPRRSRGPGRARRPQIHATTKGTPTTRAVLEQFGLLRYFDHVQGTDGFPYKPAPDVILTAWPRSAPVPRTA
jgi:phosphoglycolate phosphatase